MLSVDKGPKKGQDYRIALRQARRAPAGEVLTTANNRTCLVRKVSRPRAELLRFVVSPRGVLVPDIKGGLPGRGLWLTPERGVVEHAVQKGVFQRAARQKVKVPQDLADRVDQALKAQCVGFLGFARRAGLVVNGFEKVQSCFRRGTVALLLQATGHEGSDGCRQMAALVQSFNPTSEEHVCVFSLLDDGELGVCIGRDYAVHIAVLQGERSHGSLVACFKNALDRLAGYRGTGIVPSETGPENKSLPGPPL